MSNSWRPDHIKEGRFKEWGSTILRVRVMVCVNLTKIGGSPLSILQYDSMPFPVIAWSVDLDPSSPIFLLSGTSKVRSADIQMVQIGHPMPSRPETRDPESTLYSHKQDTIRSGYWIPLLFMNLAMLYLSVLTACSCARECCMS